MRQKHMMDVRRSLLRTYSVKQTWRFIVVACVIVLYVYIWHHFFRYQHPDNFIHIMDHQDNSTQLHDAPLAQHESNQNHSVAHNSINANTTIIISDVHTSKSNLKRLRTQRQNMLNSVAEQIHHKERSSFGVLDGYNPPKGYQINTEISPDLLMMYTNKLSHYLHILCQNSTILPSDCAALLTKMVNISVRHSFSMHEVETLAQRMRYLTTIIPQKMPYFFVHVPKSAGTALSVAFKSQLKHRFYHYWSPANVKHAQLKQIQSKSSRYMIFGHLPFGVHKVFISPADRAQTIWTMNEWMNYTQHSKYMHGMKLWINTLNYTYATVVRHPLSRVKSHFYYHQATKGDENHRWTKGKDLAQWVGFMEDSKDCSVAHIAGVHSKAWWNSFAWWRNDAQSLKLLPKRRGNEAPLKQWIITREHYTIARWNLMNMGFVGIFEHLSESVQQLKHFWNMKNIALSTKNKNVKKPQHPLTQQEIDKILAFNPGDIWLYELAVILFEQQQLALKYNDK